MSSILTEKKTTILVVNDVNDVFMQAIDELEKYDKFKKNLTFLYLHENDTKIQNMIMSEISELTISHNDSMSKIYEKAECYTVENTISYFTNIKTLDCGGDKCRMSALDGTGYHCVACNSELTYDDWKIVQQTDILHDKDGHPRTINCYGNKCRFNGENGIWCESCSGEYPGYW
jgi:hypothetical protein